MGELVKGLAYGYYVAIWAAGIAIAIAWLSRGASPLRLLVLAGAIVWPAAPVAEAFLAQHEARNATQEFAWLCEQQAYERVTRRSKPVTGIFIEGVRGTDVDPLFRELGSEVVRITRESPGYVEVQMLEPRSADGTIALRHRRAAPRVNRPPEKMTRDESIARFGVRLAFEGGQRNDAVREFSVRVVDSQTNEVLAEQKSFLYRSTAAGIGAFPFWRKQDRICPLSHPADFARAALPPQAM